MIPITSYATIFDTVINPDAYDPGAPEKSEELNKIADTVIGLIYYIGVFLSVGMLMAIGIKYITGSIEEKAQYKETMVPYILGAILLFGGINILKIIYDTVTKVI